MLLTVPESETDFSAVHFEKQELGRAAVFAPTVTLSRLLQLEKAAPLERR